VTAEGPLASCRPSRRSNVVCRRAVPRAGSGTTSSRSRALRSPWPVAAGFYGATGQLLLPLEWGAMLFAGYIGGNQPSPNPFLWHAGHNGLPIRWPWFLPRLPAGFRWHVAGVLHETPAGGRFSAAQGPAGVTFAASKDRTSRRRDVSNG
jgi:hypothetical protein